MIQPVIKSLGQAVINKIAAGEVINQPLNVVKELLENSIDAGSTTISVKIANGGYSLIKIEDDGCGIRYGDLSLACKRYATSKIREYSDLSKIATFGFRGEALYSMSCCSHLSIITKIEKDDKGYLAEFKDGELVGQIEPTPATNGTIITIKDLFYNNAIRLKERSKSAAETKKIADLVTKYSVVYPHVAFSFYSNDKELYKSFGESTFDLVLRQIYTCDDPDAFFQLNFTAEDQISAEIFLSSPGNSKAPKYSAVFLNGRLITNNKIKLGIKNVYLDVLPKGCNPFFFCVLSMPAEIVDVNIHPSKKEVRFEGESKIIEIICLKVREALLEKANQRGVEVLKNLPPKQSPRKHPIPENQTTMAFSDGNFQLLSQKEQKKKDDTQGNEIESQKKLNEECLRQLEHDAEEDEGDSGNVHNNDSLDEPVEEEEIEYIKSQRSQSSQPKKEIVNEPPRLVTSDFDTDDDENVNNDHVSSKLLSDLHEPTKQRKSNKQKENVGIFDELKYDPLLNKKPLDKSMQTLEQVLTQPQTTVPKQFRNVDLAQVLEMRDLIVEEQDLEITNILRNCEFLGFVGLRLVLFKYNSQEILVYGFSLYALLKDFFYQRMLAYFANFPQHRIDPSISIEKLIKYIYPNVTEITDFTCFYAMLVDYFSISIQDNMLYAMPQVLTGYTPTYSTLPLFLHQLSHDVNWEDERECYEGVLDALSSLYSVNPEDEDDPEEMKKIQNEIMNAVLPLIMSEEYRPSRNLRNFASFTEIPIDNHQESLIADNNEQG